MKGFRLFFIFFILSFYCFGAAVMDGFVIYHTWRFVGDNEFSLMHKESGGRIVPFFVLPMLIATICNVLLLWYRPAKLPKKLVWMALGCLAVGWLSSAFIQIPIQIQLDQGKDMALLNKLIVTDWIRTVAGVCNIAVVVNMGLVVWKGYAQPVKILI